MAVNTSNFAAERKITVVLLGDPGPLITETLSREQLIVTKTIDCGNIKEELQTLFEQNEGKPHIFLYSIPIYPCLTANDSKRAVIMKSLQDVSGGEMWERCIIVFTHGDGLWNWINRRHSKADAMIQYEQFIAHFAAMLEKQLKQLNNQKVTVLPIIGSDSEQRETMVIPVLLAEPPNRNLPDSNLEDIPDIYTSGHIIIINEIIGKDHSTKLTNQERRHKRAYKKAIKESVPLEICPVRFNYIGLPRSGKTSFRRRIMGEILNILWAIARGEGEQPSTGVAEAGGQVFIRNWTTTDIGLISSQEWIVLKDLGDELGMLGQTLQQTIHKKHSSVDPTASRKPNRNTSALYTSPQTSSACEAPQNSSAHKSTHTKRLFDSLIDFILRAMKLLVATQTSTATPESNATPASNSIPLSSTADDEIEEMFSAINNDTETKYWDEVKSHLDNIIFLINTDAGGQAEFLDLQTSLVQGPSFNLIFSRLVDELDSQFKVYYTNKEGESTEKEDSIMTTEQVLFQCLSSIACYSGTFSDGDDTPSGEDSASNSRSKTEKQSKSKVMFVGTYRDEVSQEEFEEKDMLLQEKIKRTLFYDKGIIEFASENQLMLPVDNMNGGEDEIDKIKKILEKVIKESFEKVKIPASWLVLSLLIRAKKQRTMSLEDCERLARKVRISPSDLQHALHFLHHRVGVLLYYPELEALKGTVICDIQVLYDSATNLIKNVFTFDKVGKSVSEKFREKAQFSLNVVQKATSEYTDANIPLHKLVQLLEYLGVLTVIPSSAKEPTYFMPCVLKSATPSELKIHTSGDSDPAPLMIRYDCGYIPVGMFPSMITNLVSQKQKWSWKLLERGIRKNMVRFHAGKDYDTVTLTSYPRYIEIVISRSRSFHTSTELLCSHVCKVIKSTLSTITSRMKTHFSMGYKFGFECPTHPGREHLCVLAHEKARKMECLQDEREIIPLQPQHEVWFSSGQEATFDSICRQRLTRMQSVQVPGRFPPLRRSSVERNTSRPSLDSTNNSTNHDFSSYVWSLPANARPLLEHQLDWDHEGVDKDLVEIASKMSDWEEICSHLGLTIVDVQDIKEIYSGKPELKRREVLRRWKSKQGLRATYGNLLELYVKAGHSQCAKAVCQVLRDRTQHSASKSVTNF